MQFFKRLLAQIIEDWLKDVMLYALPSVFSHVGNMIKENPIYSSLIVICGLIVVYLLKKLSQIVKNIQQFINADNKLLPFDTQLKIVDNEYLAFGLCVNNLSNQTIECITDIDKSSFIVNGLTIHRERLRIDKNTLYPFATHGIWVEIMGTENIPTNVEFEISCNMYLNYNAFLQPLNYIITCQFKGTFIMNSDEKGNKSINLITLISPPSPIN